MKEPEKNITDRREVWAFRYKPSEVLAAAKNRVKHHIERGKFWTQEHDKAEEQLKKKGFEYSGRQVTSLRYRLSATQSWLSELPSVEEKSPSTGRSCGCTKRGCVP